MTRVFLLPLMLLLFIPTPAATAEVPIRRRAVDLIILKDGTRLLGAIVSDDRRNGTDLLVRQQWLSDNAPDVVARLEDDQNEADNAANPVAALVQQYIEQIEGTPKGSLERIGYLQERLTNLQAVPAGGNLAEFVLIHIPPRQVRQRLQQTGGGPGLSTAAILNGIDDVENRSRTEVLKELRQIPQGQLLTRLPQQEQQTSSERQAEQQFRQLLVVTDRAFGTTAKLILLNGDYVSERGSAAQIQMLTTKMMMNQVQSQLQDLLNEGSGLPGGLGGELSNTGADNTGAVPGSLPAKAAAIAAAENADVVEVSEMNLNPTAGSAVVRISMYHRGAPEDDYRLATSVVGRASGADITPEQKKRIEQDSRVQQVTTMFSALGSGGQQINRALSVGAAVEVAQERARAALNQALATSPTDAATAISIRRSELVPVEE
ncbi:MAG: hypothetical protein NXI04_06085 [Planctomycetaceae bacterium]|nr:hypothetical protein [Planctomycetaceae bacterium]